MNYAGFWTRLLAHNIDLLILLPVYYFMSFLIASNSILYLVCGGLTFGYEIGFIAGPWGATPGKKYLHIRVAREDGSSLGLATSGIRAVVKAVTVLTLFIGYALVAIHPKKKGLHDLIMNTVVIFAKRR